MSEPDSFWKKCSACKGPIGFGAAYYVCSVSTCNRKRTALRFCDVGCWEVHLPVARHREAWAEERIAPSAAEAAREAAREGGGAGAARQPRRILAPSPTRSAGAAPRKRGAPPREVLIVATRLREYVRAVSDMSTSDAVLGPLSDVVREVVERAIQNARADGRKTVLERDVPQRRG